MTPDAGVGFKIPVSVLVVIHTPRLEVLLLERADRPGFWQSVTGSQDPGERLIDTAVREVREETGLEIAPASLVDWRIRNRFEIFLHWRNRYAPGVTHNLEHVFGLTVAMPVPIVIAPAEHLRFQWVSWREAVERVFSWSNADALRLLPWLNEEAAPHAAVP